MPSPVRDIHLVTKNPRLAPALALCVGSDSAVVVHARLSDFLDAPVVADAAIILDLPGWANGHNRPVRALLRARPTIVTRAGATVETAVEAMREGAVYFLEQPIDPDHLAAALTACAQCDRSHPIRLLGRLSTREREVLEGVVVGESSKAAGRRLGISPRTVEQHRARMRRKLGAPSLSILIDMANFRRRGGQDMAQAHG